MIWKNEDYLHNFEFWSGAKDRAELLTCSELDSIEDQIQELFQETPTATQINDLFWFDFDIICNMLGTTEEELDKRAKEV